MTGKGDASVDDGDITGIPLLGSLTPLIPGFSVADAAHGNFTVSHGVIHTDDMNISSELFALIGNGSYNFITDKLDLNMRVNANAIFGIPLFVYLLIRSVVNHRIKKSVAWKGRSYRAFFLASTIFPRIVAARFRSRPTNARSCPIAASRARASASQGRVDDLHLARR